MDQNDNQLATLFADRRELTEGSGMRYGDVATRNRRGDPLMVLPAIIAETGDLTVAFSRLFVLAFSQSTHPSS